MVNQEQIYIDYYQKVYSFFYGRLLNVTEAEDLASVAFLKVYEKLDSFDESKASIGTWIYHIANNTLIDYYRTRKVNSELPDILPEDMDMPTESTIEEDYEAKEELSILADVMESLPQKERDVIVLHYYNDMTLKDVAVKMQMSYSNVKILHNKALIKLKTKMEKLDQ